MSMKWSLYDCIVSVLSYYADEADAVEGGHYAPAAAGMEKLRVSLSIFFWGVMLSTGAMQIFRKSILKV